MSFQLRVLVLALALLVFPIACKKKPKVDADAGATPVKGAAASTEGLPTPAEGKIRWPVAELRDAPGGNILPPKLFQGARVAVLERAQEWTHVRSFEGSSQGWVLSEAVEGGVPLNGKPATAAAAAAAVAKANASAGAKKQVRIRTNTARIRDTPQGRVVTKLPRGTTLDVVREEGEWFEITHAGKRAWISRTVVDVVGAAAAPAASGLRPPALPGAVAAAAPVAAGPNATVRFKSVNLRDAPNGNRVDALPRGTAITVLGKRDGFVQVATADGKRGWIVETAIESTAAAAVPAAAPERAASAPPAAPKPAAASRSASISWPNVRLRDAPLTGKILHVLARGDAVTILKSKPAGSKKQTWHKVQAGGHEGWVIAAAVRAGSAAAAEAPAPKRATVAPPAPKPELAPTAAVDEPRPAPALAGADLSVVWSKVNMRELPNKTGMFITALRKGQRLRRLGAEQEWVKVQTLDTQQIGWVWRGSVSSVR